MRKLLAVGLTVLVAAVTATVVFAQELDDIQAKFESWTVSEVTATGYEPSGPCVSAALVDAPAAPGAMGQHYINDSLVDGTLDVLTRRSCW